MRGSVPEDEKYGGESRGWSCICCAGVRALRRRDVGQSVGECNLMCGCVVDGEGTGVVWRVAEDMTSGKTLT